MLSAAIAITPVHAEEDISVDIRILDQPPQFNNNKPKIVAGLWHRIHFSGLKDTNTVLTLTVYQGSSIPSQKNSSNYYQWKFTPLTVEPWQINTTYGEHTINTSYCDIESDTITFCIGIPDYFPDIIFHNEEWTLELAGLEEILFKDTFYLEKPTRGFAKSRGDFISFSVDPFTVMRTTASDYITLKNTGNVPLNISIDYKALDDLLTYIESSDQIPAYSSQNYKLSLDSLSWKPQRIQQTGIVVATVFNQYLLDESVSGTAISLQTALIIDVPNINIFVGHNSYELTTLDDSTGFSFQHQKRVSMYEEEIRTLNSYFSGNGTATVSIQTNNNLSLIQINRNNQQIQSPFTIISTDEEEQIIGVQIKALSENRNGLITYTIETEKGTNTFTTYIVVGPPETNEGPAIIGATSPVTIVVLLALILAASYILYNHLFHNRSKI